MSKKISYAFVLFLICTTCLLAICQANESSSEDFKEETSSGEYHGNLDENTKKQLRECDMNLETMELCMRCAKITKSTIVYPLCCANEDGIKDWCNAYIYYGASE